MRKVKQSGKTTGTVSRAVSEDVFVNELKHFLEYHPTSEFEIDLWGMFIDSLRADVHETELVIKAQLFKDLVRLHKAIVGHIRSIKPA